MIYLNLMNKIGAKHFIFKNQFSPYEKINYFEATLFVKEVPKVQNHILSLVLNIKGVSNY